MTTTAVASPVADAIREFNRGRKPKRLDRKYRLMEADAFAFFRGTDHLFAAAWPDLQPPDVGPMVLCCGDLHLENFGAYRAEDGRFLFDVNDFDEAVVAPCSMDLVRCTTSILLAAEEWKLTPLMANRMVLALLHHYRTAVERAARDGAVGVVDTNSARGPIRPLLAKSAQATQVELLDRQAPRGKGDRRRIARSRGKHPAVGPKRFAKVKEAVEAYGSAESFEVLDVTGRIVGVGSLGVRRYLVLVKEDGEARGERLFDVKEALRSSWLGCPGVSSPPWPCGEAERVAEAQRRLQARPPAGLGTLAIDGRPFRIREMIPDENRASLDRLKCNPGKLRRAVSVAGMLAAWSQVRGARTEGEDRTAELARWAAGPALDALLAVAARFAERTRRDHHEYRRAYAAGQLDGRRE